MSISSSSAGIVSQTESFKQRTLKHFGPCIMATSQFLVLQHMCMHSCMFFTGPRSWKMPANWPPLRVTLYSMSSCPQLYSSRIVWPKTAEKHNCGKIPSVIINHPDVFPIRDDIHVLYVMYVNFKQLRACHMKNNNNNRIYQREGL